MYKLYYMNGTCSMAVRVLLNELNIPFEAEDVRGKNHDETFLKINPLGQVPVLEIKGEKIIREGAAILVTLLERHPNPLWPTSKKEHEAALEALMFCNATLHPAYGRGFFISRNFPGASEFSNIQPELEKYKEHLLKAVVISINKLWKEVEQRLDKTEFLGGNQITVADILLTVIANWSERFPGIEIGDNAKNLFKKVIARPAFKKALEEERVEYKAAN